MTPSLKVSFFNKFNLFTVLLLFNSVGFAQIATVDQTRRSIVRIETVFGDCNGVLIQSPDNRQLVLTARHCFDDNFALGRFIFGGLAWLPGTDIQKSSWNTIAFELLAESKDLDYALFALPESIPEQFLPYAAGWNAFPTHPLTTYGFSIISDTLVPYEDINRPALFTNNAIEDFGGTPVENGAWWIKSWERGFTSIGSSGAPLFDQWSRVIGVLSAGASSPEAPFNDFFSRFDLIYNEETAQIHLGLDVGSLNGAERYERSKIRNYSNQTFVLGSIGADEISEHFDLPTTTIYGVYIPIVDIDPSDHITIQLVQDGIVRYEQTSSANTIIAQQENYMAFTETLNLSGPTEILLINNGSASFPLLEGPTSINADNLVLEQRSIGLGILTEQQEIITASSEFRVFPNPVQNNLYIEGVKENDEIEFIDLYGNEVFPRITTDYLGRQVYNVDSFTDGIYLLILPSDEVIRLFVDN